MKYLSVCSGIEAASAAWHDLGWRPVGFAEIEPFPSAVLAHRFPTIPNFGDMNKYKEWPIDRNTHRHAELDRGSQFGGDRVRETGRPELHDNEGTFSRSGDSGGNDASETRYGNAPDILVGGTPCQSFSVAGLRKGLDDPRGNLMLVFGAIADHFKPTWIVWENVPGVLSSNGGRDFGSFIKMLGELGYGVAYRVLDAQYFGVAQRRRRVFVVGYLGDWRRAAAVLFESESLSGNPAPSRKAGKDVAVGVAQGATGSHKQSSIYFGLDGDVPSDQSLTETMSTREGHVTDTSHGVVQYYESHPADSRITGPHDIGNTVIARYGTGGATPRL